MNSQTNVETAPNVSADVCSVAGSDSFARRLLPFERRLRLADFDDLEMTQRVIGSDRPIWAEEDSGNNFYVLQSGFAYSFTLLPDGRRYISDIFGPGAICNWTRPRQPSFPANILFKARSVLGVLPTDRLIAKFGAVPGIENAIVRHEHMRALRSSQRTRTLVVGQSADRLLHLLIDLADELSVTGGDCKSIPVPLTQREIADMLGMSPVHLNRTIQSLRQERRIVRYRRTYTICDPQREKELLGYRSFRRIVGGGGTGAAVSARQKAKAG